MVAESGLEQVMYQGNSSTPAHCVHIQFILSPQPLLTARTVCNLK